MLHLAGFRKTLCLALLAGTLTPPALLVSPIAGPHTAQASITVVPPPPPVDGTWTDAREPISPIVVTREQTQQGGRILTRFVVQTYRGAQYLGSGTTDWALLGFYDFGTISVTIPHPCSSAPVSFCPNLSTALTLTTGTLTTINGPLKIAGVKVVDHTLTGVVSWTETLFHA